MADKLKNQGCFVWIGWRSKGWARRLAGAMANMTADGVVICKEIEEEHELTAAIAWCAGKGEGIHALVFRPHPRDLRELSRAMTCSAKALSNLKLVLVDVSEREMERVIGAVQSMPRWPTQWHYREGEGRGE